MIVRLYLRGTVDDVVTWASERDDEQSSHPAKLWEALAPESAPAGMPLYPGPAMPGGNILDVIEHLPNGIVRRTWWRMP